jgi:hypothetical protein
VATSLLAEVLCHWGSAPAHENKSKQIGRDPQVLTIEEGNRRPFASRTRFAAKWTPRRRFFARTMADKALLRFSLVITPMRAEDTVISSRTRGIWTDQRDARLPDPPLHRRKRDPRSHGSLAAGVAASSQMVWQLCTKVARSSMTCEALRTRITLVCPDPPCTTADDTVSSARIGVMTSLMRNRALTAIVEFPKRGRAKKSRDLLHCWEKL